MWLHLQDYCLTTYVPIVLGTLTVITALSKLTSPIAQLTCSTFLSITVASIHGHSDLPIIMLSLITGTIMIGALHGTTSRVTTNVVYSTTTVVCITIVAALLIVNEPIAGIAVYADATTQADAGYMHYKGYLLVWLLSIGGLELSSAAVGIGNLGRLSGMVSLLGTTDFLLVALSTGLALAPMAARMLVNKVDSDSSAPTSTTVRESSYACGMNANSPNAATSPNTSVMNVQYTLCFVYAEILILALISAYSPEHSGLPMNPTYILLLGVLAIIATTAGNWQPAVASSCTPVVGLPSNGSNGNKASNVVNGNKTSNASKGSIKTSNASKASQGRQPVGNGSGSCRQGRKGESSNGAWEGTRT